MRYFNRARSLAVARVTTQALPGRSPTVLPFPWVTEVAAGVWRERRLCACAGPLGPGGGGGARGVLSAGRGRERCDPGVTVVGLPLGRLSGVRAAPSQPHRVGEEATVFLRCWRWGRHRSSLSRGPSPTSGPFSSPLKMAAGVRGGSRGGGLRAAADDGGGAAGAGSREQQRLRVESPGVCGHGLRGMFQGFHP